MESINTIPYCGVSPAVKGSPTALHAGHAVIGRVTLGARSFLGAGSVIRGDGHYVEIGDDFHLGRGSTVHISHDRYPTIIGDRVTVGANAVVHACTVGNDVVIGDGAVILDNVTVGDGVHIAPNTVVFPSFKLEGGTAYAGRPAVGMGTISAEELAMRALELRKANASADSDWYINTSAMSSAPSAYVANTVGIRGDVSLGESASVWFGCYLNARGVTIRLGESCNVQDNSTLLARKSGIYIGEHSTIGHNVRLNDCHIGDRCLVGMGSCIAEGTVIPDDTFVAAGCITKPGDRLQGGYLWGGAPARILGEMDSVKREIILTTSQVYSEYASNLSANNTR